MTKRKPAGVPFETWVDAQIRHAREQGDFDDLPGHGEPLRNLDEADDPYWWAKQLMRREDLSLLPPALEVKVRVRKLEEELADLPSERKVRKAVEELNQAIRKANRLASQGPPTTQAPLDAEDVVARWREARAGRED